VNNDTQLFCLPINVVIFLMVVESTFELEFTRIAAVMTYVKVQIWQPSELHSFYDDNIIFTSKTKTSCYFAVVFVCTMFYKNIFST
jgi:hypothetical protein